MASGGSLIQQIDRVRELLQGSARPGLSTGDLVAAERRLGATFPSDVRALLSAFDGSDNFTERAMVTFWPVASWRAVSTEPLLRGSPRRDTILIADHLMESWWYALDLGEGSQSAIYLISGLPGDPPLVAASISDFLQAVIDDDPVLYL
jgi:hypothetical protein